MIALGEKMGIIQKSGTSYAYGDEKLGRGYDATRTFLKENPKVKKRNSETHREKDSKMIILENSSFTKISHTKCLILMSSANNSESQ
jgi:hypothetical protein